MSPGEEESIAPAVAKTSVVLRTTARNKRSPTEALMNFQTTRRRFITLASSLLAAMNLRPIALGESRASIMRGLKPLAGDVEIWFDQPAPEWAAALPVGNGRIGAMVFGGVLQERIALNEDTLWSGAPSDWNNPDAKHHLPVVRKLLLEEKDYHAADAECRYMQGPYN